MYAITILLSSYLLFQVQPMAARFILPWFGGSSAVWTTALVFFQLILLGAYLYSYLSTKYLTPRSQRILHLSLLAVSLLFIPTAPHPFWKPSGSDDFPIFLILGELSTSVGVPYFLLTSTTPLLQAWYARENSNSLPYRLFALSNAASLLGLMIYPIVVEPLFTLRQQSLWWSSAYIVFSGVSAATAWKGKGLLKEVIEILPPVSLSLSEMFMWFGLSATSSALMLSVSSRITQDVVPFPFLWIIPLALYLVSFILTFESDLWYRRKIWFPASALGVAAILYIIRGQQLYPLWILLAVFLGTLFSCCMACHGELARIKPLPANLTTFYLMIAFGGATGGLSVAILAPLALNGYFELHASMAALAIMAAIVLKRSAAFSDGITSTTLASYAWIGGTLALCVYLPYAIRSEARFATRMVRNFYGVLTVEDEMTARMGRRVSLVYGIVNHGRQFPDGPLRTVPTTYYGWSSGVGRALLSCRLKGAIKAGFIGMGIGTLASYGEKGDLFTFYEINPQVITLARENFTYLTDSRALVKTVVGDGRISLEKEPPNNYGLIAVDAFSGDAIPTHLLTQEALQVYFSHLNDDGILAIHISSVYVDLEPVLAAGLQSLGKSAVVISDPGDAENVIFPSLWVLAVSNPARLGGLRPDGVRLLRQEPATRTWTDNYSNVVSVLNFSPEHISVRFKNCITLLTMNL